MIPLHFRLSASIFLTFTTVLTAQDSVTQGRPPVPLNPVNTSLQQEVRAAINRAADWLKTQQKPDGSWSSPDFPALTALPITALLKNGVLPPDDPVLAQALKFITDLQKEDGGVYQTDKGYYNYNTSLVVLAWHATGQTAYHEPIRRARRFIVGQQNDFNEPGISDHPLDGGIGYGRTRAHADMSNTVFALEALRATRHLDQDAKEPAPQLNWDAAIGFLERCQNLPSHNKESWVTDDPSNLGGFVYYPGHSMAGEMELPDGRKALRSYGSMSYAGLLSYIYADLKPDDPRVLAVVEWLKKNYTLQENPGMGAEGLFYYYHLLAKGLDSYGLTELPTADGKAVNWPEDLARHLLNAQKTEGFWINDDKARWMEQDPVLVTSYALLALSYLEKRL